MGSRLVVEKKDMEKTAERTQLATCQTHPSDTFRQVHKSTRAGCDNKIAIYTSETCNAAKTTETEY